MIDASKPDADPPLPARIGRYRTIRVLGRGGFGTSYLAFDEQANQPVVVKVIGAEHGSTVHAAYARQAGKVAHLKHPNIAPVLEIGGAPDFPCFIVSKFVEGRPITAERMTCEVASKLVASVAEVLHAAHKADCDHTDIRPSNLIVDRHGTPHLLDFGLALPEHPDARDVEGVSYFSPEQARDEGHRVEGGSDIFSLGAVYYELLTGLRPFTGDTARGVLAQIIDADVRPPRSIDDTIPRELDRICLKALQRQVRDRHSTAGDLAEDLRVWLQNPNAKPAIEAAPAKALAPPTHAFISHASADYDDAWRICQSLEARGFKCWIAPRDIPYGQDWATVLPHAIAATRVLLCLITERTEGSKQVPREVLLADQLDKVLVPVRMQKVELGERLQFILQLKHRVEAYKISHDDVIVALVPILRDAPTVAPTARSTPVSQTLADDDDILIDPKGPGSFEEKDAHYFLRLLPGQRDRNGLPPGAAFWKERVDSLDPALAFPVGIVHGPSGCGKTSRVKAALLTRLADTVIPVYLEATSDATEERMLRELHKKVPALPHGIGLVAAMAAIRQGQYAPPGCKVTLFLDQFEQWLHANPEDHNAILVQALRHCNGVRLQCVLMIRDEFWTAVTRFMHSLELDADKNNSRLIDLFDLKHAREVLIFFGQAMRALPRNKAEITKEQYQFLDRAIKELAVERRIVCVRLSMFAAMVEDREWTPATLNSFGGIDGIGATFLEEKFASRNSSEKYRGHLRAAQNVLRALLPDETTDIKGQRRSLAELRAASEYGDDHKRFDELIGILHGDLRLIALADREGHQGDAERATAERPAMKYQLTHDYLVPSLRDWLTRKQKETRRGRAELRLQEYASVWGRRPADRHLPSFLLWLQILRSAPLRKASDVQRAMFRRASFYHSIRFAILLVVGATLATTAYVSRNRMKADSLRDRIVDAKTSDVPAIVTGNEYYRPWLDPLLKQSLDERHDARIKLNCSLALLPVDPGQVEYLTPRLLEAEPGDVVVLVKALANHAGALRDELWKIVEGAKSDPQRRLRAAAALARFEPRSEKWKQVSSRIVDDLVRESPVHLGAWLEAFEPIKAEFFKPLLDVLGKPRREARAAVYQSVAEERAGDRIAAERAAERSIASNVLLNYAAKDLSVLTEALLESDEQQFPKFLAVLNPQSGAEQYLLRELVRSLGGIADPAFKDRLANRIANAGVYIIMLNTNFQYSVWDLLKLTRDPSVRSYLISRLGRLGADPKIIADQLLQDANAPGFDSKYDIRNDPAVHRALVQSLGAFPESAFPGDLRAKLRDTVRTLYRDSPDAGMHASAEWLLREWKDDDWLRSAVSDWKKDPRQKAKFERITSEYSEFVLRGPADERPAPQWFVGNYGHTMIAIPGGIRFQMGSPPTEQGRLKSEEFKKKKIGRSFALSSKLTTVAQFDLFDQGAHSKDLPGEFGGNPALGGHQEKPVVRATWFQVAKYCNWLSAREGIDKTQWCYEIDGKGDVIGMKPNYLDLTGYRLPTEAEVEYANRATTTTCRHYGETEELLGEYAWYEKNSDEITRPVGTRKPNDFGLFDMQGNAFTWCQDLLPDPAAKYNEDDVSIAEPTIGTSNKRILRGGAFYFMAISLRAARQHHDVPTMQGLYYGFRVAKTLELKR